MKSIEKYLRAAGLATTVALGAAACGSASEPMPKTEAVSIANALNSPRHVANNITVENGFQISVKPNSIAQGVVAIINPIKLGHDSYGYIAPGTAQSGKVKVGTYHYDKPLQPLPYGGFSKENANQLTTPVALVYESYKLADGEQQKQYSVTMGDHGGNEASLYVIEPGASELERQQEVAQQAGQIATAEVGDLAYQGK
jgi:hypothetical protein